MKRVLIFVLSVVLLCGCSKEVSDCNRLVRVYSADGDVIRTYDVDGLVIIGNGYVTFRSEGKKHSFVGCYVEVEE